MLAKDLAKENVTVGRIDVSHNHALSSVFEVKGIPVFYLCRENKIWKYDNYQVLTAEGLTQFSLHDYLDETPMSLWSSPMGMLGTFKLYLIQFGDQALDFIPNLSTKYGVSNAFGMFLVAMSCAVFLLFATIVGVYFSVIHAKND
eukprot:CAMPEP_0201107272 /NCGR_PEP_ID=MMETSP0812-20130820/55768_1 /ASSEMBLY_ACC=CAM_ASM_000668 /TAXON_ID=98059 /ORGANISM="Dinobryon sp., Strain UTEXLB2267" /LENGTH=144 /DNA_ID=CAMNT_0047368039 /DNA_START=149 /DNA_END=583 /DNA_ORIENTATION=-